MPRCLRCNHPISDSTKPCDVCGEDNSIAIAEEWWVHAKRFSVLIWVSIGIVLALLVVLTLSSMSKHQQNDALHQVRTALWVASLATCVVIVAVVFVLKAAFRHYELVREATGHKSRPSLAVLAGLSLAGAVLCTIAAAAFFWIASQFAPPGDWQISTIDVETGETKLLLRDAGNLMSPAVSPDGTKLLFASNQDGDWDVYTRDLRSGAETNLTNNADADYAPAWAENGSKIVFVSNREGRSRLFMMETTGEHPYPLSAGDIRATNLVWVPQDNRVVFLTASLGFSSLFADPIRLTFNASLLATVFTSAVFPFLVLALMLVGVKAYTSRTGAERTDPIFVDPDDLADIAMKSVLDYIGMKRGEGNGESDIIVPRIIGNGSPSASQPAAQKRAWQELHVESVKRLPDGGLALILRLEAIREDWDEKTGKPIQPRQILRKYAVDVTRWGYVRTLGEVSTAKGKGGTL